MSASSAFGQMLQELLFLQNPIPGLSEHLYISLHRASPGEAGNQESSEAQYGGYVRETMLRSVGVWIVSGGIASNENTLYFPECISGSESLTHWAVGMDATGPGTILFYGDLSAPLVIAPAVIPRFDIGNLDISVD